MFAQPSSRRRGTGIWPVQEQQGRHWTKLLNGLKHILFKVGKPDRKLMKADELNILVVEDDDFQRRRVVSMLRSLGATSVCDAGDGQQAIEIIRRENEKPMDIV